MLEKYDKKLKLMFENFSYLCKLIGSSKIEKVT